MAANRYVIPNRCSVVSIPTSPDSDSALENTIGTDFRGPVNAKWTGIWQEQSGPDLRPDPNADVGEQRQQLLENRQQNSGWQPKPALFR